MGILSPTARQFLAVGCCNLLTLSYGISSGWGTINNVELKSANTTYGTGPLTETQATLIVSLPNFGGLIGNFAIVPISMYFGVKRTIHLLGIPLILSSLMTMWMQNIYALYFARCLVGFIGGGITVGIPSFIIGISHAKVRGMLNSMWDLSFNIGMLLSFYIGNHLDCVDQIKMQLIAPIIFMLAMPFFPESPEHLQNNEKRAIRSQKFFRGKHSVADNVQFKSVPMDECIESDKTKNKRDTNPDTSEFKAVPTDECVETGVTQQTDKWALSDLLTREAKRAMCISLTSLFLSLICGVVTIFGFVTSIFHEIGSSMSDKDSSLLISLVQLSANIVVLNIVDRFNRRTLFLWSSALTTVAFFLFSIHCTFWSTNPNLTWMPPFCFSSIMFFGCLGILPIPFILTTEIYPRKISSTCIAFSISCVWITLFLSNSAYPHIKDAIGVGNCFFGFGLITIIGAIFGYIYMPETRGKSHDEIMALLRTSQIR